MRRLLFGLTLCALTAQASFAQSIAPEVFRALQAAQAAQQSGNVAQCLLFSLGTGQYPTGPEHAGASTAQ